MPGAATPVEATPEDRDSPVPSSSPRKKEQEDRGAEPPAREKKPLSPLKRGLLIGGGLLLACAGAAYWYHGTFFEDTDDAQIDGNITSVSSRVNGTVISVSVDDNQPVTVNQLLVELDATDSRVARDQAKAALAQAQAQLRAEQSGAAVTETSNETLVATSASDV